MAGGATRKPPFSGVNPKGKVPTQVREDGTVRTEFGAAFAAALRRPVRMGAAPREQWVESLREKGFSEVAARSYARMTTAGVDGDYEVPSEPERGATTLASYVEERVAWQAAEAS